MSRKERPLNPDAPYYEWGENEDGRLTIYSECCADSFNESEERVLLAALAQKHVAVDRELMAIAYSFIKSPTAFEQQAFENLTRIYNAEKD